MSVIIRLQNLPLTANSVDIRHFFSDLGIPEGGVHIVGGTEGVAFIAFSTDEDARQGMNRSGNLLKDSPVKLFLSSRNEMCKVIEQARQQSLNLGPTTNSPITHEEPPQQVILPPIHHHHQQPPQQQQQQQPPPMLQPPIHQQQPNQMNPMVMAPSAVPLGFPLGNQMSQLLSQPPPSLLPGHPGHSGHPPPNLGFGNVPMGLQGFPGFQNNLPPNMSSMGIPPPHHQQQQQPPPMLQQHHQHQLQQQQQHQNSNPFGMMSMDGLHVPSNNSVNPFILTPTSNNIINNVPQFPSSLNSTNTPNPAILSNMGNGQPFGRMNNVGNQHQNHQQQQLGPGFAPGPNNVNNAFNQGMNSGILGQPNNGSMIHPGGPIHNQRPSFNNNHDTNSNMNKFGPRNNNGPGMRQHLPSHNNNNNISNNKGGFGGMRQGQGQGDKGPDLRDSIRESKERNPPKRSRSRSRERRDRTRRRSRSRERSREKKRVRGRNSRSRSRSRERNNVNDRRPLRYFDKRPDSTYRRRSDSSPEKSASIESLGKNSGRSDRRDSDSNSEEFPCVKLSGLPKDVSFREIREFVRVEIEGGVEGVTRNFENCFAFIKLCKPSDFIKVYRNNGRKLRSGTIAVEGISLERWEEERIIGERSPKKMDKDARADRRASRFSANEKETNSICIKGLPPLITDKDVAERLLRDFPYRELILVPPRSGQLTAVAYVVFESSQLAGLVIESVIRSTEGVSFGLTAEFTDIQQVINARIDGKRTYVGDEEKVKPLFDLDIGLDSEATSVMMRGLPPNVNDRDVVDFFSDIGLIPMNVQILTDSMGCENGQVICEFSDSGKARRATTKDGMMYGRATINVSLHGAPERKTYYGGNISNNNISNSNQGNFPPRTPKFEQRGPSLLGQRPQRFQNASPNPFIQNMNGQANGPGPRPRIRTSNPRVFSNDRDERGPGRRQNEEESNLFNNPECIVALENVPFKASMDDILQFLEDVLKTRIPRDRIIRRYNEMKQATGDARVAFNSPYEASQAHSRLLGSAMWGRQITVNILNHF